MADIKKITHALENSAAKITMMADGFVDEVWEIIKSRSNIADFSVYARMNQFADRITGSGSGGVGLELIRKRRTFGGFAPNIGYASACLGVDTTLIGVFGKNKLDPAFQEVAELCTVHSLDDPSVTHVFEFGDGKILMSYMETVQDVSWKKIVDLLGIEKIKSLLEHSDVIGIGYWSLLPAFSEILENICENLPSDGKQRRFFFDFADFRKKDATSLNEILQDLKRRNEKYPMMLSVNEHEGAALFKLYGETLDDKKRPVQEKAGIVREQIGIDELIIHAPNYAVAVSSKEDSALAASVFCEKPIRTAGGGDTFNGGYIAARLAGLEMHESLHVANAAVGYFLRNAKFPKIEDLMFF